MKAKRYTVKSGSQKSFVLAKNIKDAKKQAGLKCDDKAEVYESALANYFNV